ncbi:glycosyltransferase family 4 protein [Luteimonas sp. MJ204]|uniref:glycosyltransferase family 4 protein n=1 Tax=Luteimonas sp. MJ145 TaxID=3129234 RepID=UPI0031B9F6B6
MNLTFVKRVHAMKILYLVNGIRGSGGLERVLLHKASYLSDAYGHVVSILVLNEPPGEPFYPVSRSVKVTHFHAAGSAVAYIRSYRRGLREEVARFQPDVVCVCDDGLKGLVVPLLLPRPGPALVYERHASLELMRSRWQRIVMPLLARLYDQLVLLTHSNVKEWRVPGAVVIPNPLPDFATVGTSERKKQILCVGSLSRNKGYDLLVDAWSRIAARHPDWVVHVYGKGDPAPYMALASAREVAGQIEFHPPVADIGARYAEAAMLVLPSRSEGFGMVLLEAMFFGTPCVSFDCPSGPGDILTSGVDGVLVAPENTVALADAVEQLIMNPGEREALGQQARVTAAKYGIDEIGARWHQLFTLLARSP